jgi:hypothetical protein
VEGSDQSRRGTRVPLLRHRIQRVGVEGFSLTGEASIHLCLAVGLYICAAFVDLIATASGVVLGGWFVCLVGQLSIRPAPAWDGALGVYMCILQTALLMELAEQSSKSMPSLCK